MFPCLSLSAVSLQDKDKAQQTRSLCTDEILLLNWMLVQSQDCSSPFFISWHFSRTNQKEQKRIGFSQGGRNSFTVDFATRINVTERVSLTIHDLSTNDSGTYTVKLSYLSDVGSKSKNPEGVAFSESPINVMVYEANSSKLANTISLSRPKMSRNRKLQTSNSLLCS